MAFIIPDELDQTWARMVVNQPSFASYVLTKPLPFKLHVGDPSYTLRCSATHITIGWEWLCSMDPDTQVAGILHECVHDMFAHVSWLRLAITAGHIAGLPVINEYVQFALDYQVNSTLNRMSVDIPPDWLFNESIGKWDEDEETIYKRVYQADPLNLVTPDPYTGGPGERQFGKGEPGAGDGQGGEGDVDPDLQPDEDESNPPDTARQQRLARIAVSEAPKLRGVGKGELERVLERISPTRIPWKDVIRPRARHILGKDNSTWAAPNRRALSIRAVLPGRVGKRAGFITVVIDTSGSIYDYELQKFAAGLEEIMTGCHPKKLLVLDTDYVVQRDRYLTSPRELRVIGEGGGRSRGAFHGGGGTRMPAAFDWLKERQLRPDLVIVLTDMETDTSIGDLPPSKVVWVSTREAEPAPAHHGRTVYMPRS